MIEKTIKPSSGWLMLSLMILLLVTGGLLLLLTYIIPGIVLLLVALVVVVPGFIAVEPNSSRVMTLFGTYTGTIKESGFFYTNFSLGAPSFG